MPIPLDEPVIIPSIPEKTFESIWILDLVVNARGGDMNPDSTIYLNYAPFNANTHEINYADSKELTVPLWYTAGTNPTVAAALSAVYAAVPAIIAAYNNTL